MSEFKYGDRVRITDVEGARGWGVLLDADNPVGYFLAPDPENPEQRVKVLLDVDAEHGEHFDESADPAEYVSGDADLLMFLDDSAPTNRRIHGWWVAPEWVAAEQSAATGEVAA